MDTVVIEIRADYKDNTRGMSKSIDGMDKFSRSIDKTKQQLDKAATSTDNWYHKIKNIAGKAISIPIKIIDYATRPLRSLFNFATSLKGVLTGLFVGQSFNKLVSSPLKLADQYSSAMVGFQTLFQSQAKAQNMMHQIDQFAIKTPFNTSNVISNIQKMMAYGWDSSRLLSDMETIGNAAAATGKLDDGLTSIVYALSEIRSKGKLSTQELNQLASAGIKAKQYLAEGLGFGTDDAGMAKLAKALEKGQIGANQAIDLILKGMQEFDGMMDLMATETVDGLISQLKDMFEVNLARKWGQGLQDGAKRGLGAISTFLDENRDKLEKFGDQLYEIGNTLSNWLADRAENTLNRLLEVTNSAEFKTADLGGKFKLVWDEVVAEPFSEWWNGDGGAQFKAKAEAVGETIGEWIGNGLAKVFGQIFPNMLGSAAKILPGGEKADANSWMSAGILAYLGGKLGLGKAAGWAIGKIGAAGTAGAGTAGAAGAGAAGIGTTMATGAGVIFGGLGLISSINDFVTASKKYTDRQNKEYNARGAAKLGMVAAGAALGSVIPGIGTAVGAALGGVAALLGGNAVGSLLTEDGRKHRNYKKTAENIEKAADNFETASAEAEAFSSDLERLKDINAIVKISEASDSVKVKTIANLRKDLNKIDGAKAELEVKKSEGSLTDEELSELQRLETEGIIIKAIINEDELGTDDIAAIEKRIDDLDGKKITIYTKLANGEGDPESLQSELDAIESEELILTAVINPNVDNVVAAYKNIEERDIELNAKLNTAKTPEEVAAIKKQIETNDQYRLILEATIQGFDETELSEFTSQVELIKTTLVEASNGIISAYEAEHGALDTTIEKLERINELKATERELALQEMAMEVAKGLPTLNEQEAEIKKIDAELEELNPKWAKASELYMGASELETEIRTAYKDAELNGGQLTLRDSYSPEFLKFWDEHIDESTPEAVLRSYASEKANELYNEGYMGVGKNGLPSDNIFEGAYGFDKQGLLNVTSWMRMLGEYDAFKDSNSDPGLTPMVDVVDENINKYLGDRREELLENKEELYSPMSTTRKNQTMLLQEDYYGQYGGSMDELIERAAGGDTAAMTSLLKMFGDIAENEKYLNPEDQFNPASKMQDFEDAIPNWYAAQFAGMDLAEGNDIGSMMYNALVEKGNMLVTPENLADYTDALFKKDEEGNFTGETWTSDELKAMDSDTFTAVQEGLINLGYTLDEFGPDGKYGGESQKAYDRFASDYEKSGNTPEEYGFAKTSVPDAVKEMRGLLFGEEYNKTGGGYVTPTTVDPLHYITDTFDSSVATGAVEDFVSNGLQTPLVSEATTSMSDEFTNAGAFASLAGFNLFKLSNDTALVSEALAAKAREIQGISINGVAIKGWGENGYGTLPYTERAEGGVLTGPEFVLAGEDGDEAIIPLSRKHRRRGLALFKEAARRMGIPMMAKGGIVGSGDSDEDAPVSVSANGISISLGGMHFTIQAGSGDSEGIINAIKAHMPSIANEVADAIAAQLEQTYSNMATVGV